jgi:hypothetical protein
LKPFSHSLIEKIPTPAYVTGIIASLLCFSAYFVVALRAGLVDRAVSWDTSSIELRASMTVMILIGYLPVAHWYLRKWSAERIVELNENFAMNSEAPVPKDRNLLCAGIIGSCAFIALFHILPSQNYLFLQPWTWSFNTSVVVIASIPVGWWMGRLSYELIWSALQLTQISQQLPELNLLDVNVYKPFTQHGIKNTLLIVILMSITSHLAIRPEGAIMSAVIFMTIMLILTGMGLMLPMRGIHKRIQHRKSQELAIIREQIRQERDKLFAKPGELAQNVVPLLALEARLERVREWPFDMGSLSRFSFYLLLGLGSWVGAALVERFLNIAM